MFRPGAGRGGGIPMAREKDTRKMNGGVQLFHDDLLKTYVPGQEDELEAAMTAGEYAHLTAEGVLEGDWSPAGTPKRAPTPEERAAKAQALKDLDPKALQPGLTREELATALKDHVKGSAGLVTRFRHPS